MKPLLIILALVLCGCDNPRSLESYQHRSWQLGVICGRINSIQECEALWERTTTK